MVVNECLVVTYIVGCLTGLVEGNNSAGARQFCGQTKRLDKAQGSFAVQTSRAVVPTLNGALVESSLGDADSLPLTSANTSDKVVANLCIDGVTDSKYGHDSIAKVFSVDSARCVGDTVLWRTCKGCKEEGFSDGEMREVDVGFCLVYHLSTEVAVHQVPWDTLGVSIMSTWIGIDAYLGS